MKNAGLKDYAETEQEWYEKLNKLIQDQSKREKNAREGLNFVKKNINNNILNKKWNNYKQFFG